MRPIPTALTNLPIEVSKHIVCNYAIGEKIIFDPRYE